MEIIRDQAIIIEELSRDKKLIGRHKFEQNAIAVGRSYHNDIIVSDQHVCPEHLNIEFNGENWIVTDLESINGSFLGPKKQPVDQHIIKSGDIVSLGKSKVRFIFPSHPVQESVIFSPFDSLIRLFKQPYVLITSIALFACLSGYLFNLNRAIETPFSPLFVSAVKMTLLFAIWPLGVSLVAHLTKNDARVWHQLGMSFIFFNLLFITDLFSNILNFNTSSDVPTGVINAILPLVLSFSLFWLNSYISFDMTNTRRKVVAAGLTLLFFGGNFIIQLSLKPDFDPRPHYNNTLMTPNYLFTSPNTVNRFIEKTDELFEKTSEQAHEK